MGYFIPASAGKQEQEDCFRRDLVFIGCEGLHQSSHFVCRQKSVSLHIRGHWYACGRVLVRFEHVPSACQVEQIPEDHDNSPNGTWRVLFASHPGDYVNDALGSYLVQEKMTKVR